MLPVDPRLICHHRFLSETVIMDIETPPIAVYRVEELWFDDGNIVLQAGSAQYRVFRGILARNSAVFQDMLSFPQPPNEELVDGCPLVYLPDNEVEVTPFLKALFIPGFFPPFPARTSFVNIYGCLRLAHKYAVDGLRRTALVHFSSWFRTSLREWEVTEYEEERSERSPAAVATWSFPDDLSLIACAHLAREVDARWTLPNIFYVLGSRLRECGTDVFHGTTSDGITSRLGLGDQKRFLSGFLRQTQATWDVAAFMHTSPHISSSCLHPSRCSAAIILAASQSFPDCRDWHASPLGFWVDDDWKRYGDLCGTCLATLKAEFQDSRQRFWDQLPEMYGLPPWTQLEEMKEAAIGRDMLI
ncbi:hypothetical protein HMN09_01133000 [Mycena chlorophos]|uniref:BTB domain-containing protein n=1 Tax=Mycena chlorophos TaxID=658473 RepID=A0A8H6VZD8_MYCCL|nr:hypothetical protein HMN09_01133000 [Mycena chlorophos]